MSSAVATFEDTGAALQTSAAIMQTGAQIGRMEFLDEICMRANNIYSKMSLAEKPTLFLEFHGMSEAVKGQAELAKDICQANGCVTFEWAVDPDERNKLWAARHNMWFAFKALYPNRKVSLTKKLLLNILNKIFFANTT